MIQNQIIETKYCIKEAVGQIPSGKLIDAKKAIAKILGLSSYGQIWYYITGKSQPSLPKAKAVEKYFNETFGIKDVWKEVSK